MAELFVPGGLVRVFLGITENIQSLEKNPLFISDHGGMAKLVIIKVCRRASLIV